MQQTARSLERTRADRGERPMLACPCQSWDLFIPRTTVLSSRSNLRFWSCTRIQSANSRVWRFSRQKISQPSIFGFSNTDLRFFPPRRPWAPGP